MEEALTLEQQQALALARARRKRAEAEQGVQSAEQTATEQPMWPRVKKIIGPYVEGAGAIGGGLLGTAAGPVGTVGGAGLGYAAARQALRAADEYFGAPRQNPLQAVSGAVEDVATGGLMEVGGQAIPVVAKGAAQGAKWLGSKVTNALDLVRSSGPANILDRYTTKIVGEQNIPAVANAARNVQEILPGGKPKLSEAVAGLPEGSPLQAFEKVVAETPGGESAKFGVRAAEQAAAVEAAKAARTAKSNINYGKAFDPALHRLKPDAELYALAQNPYFQSAIPTAEKVSQAKGLNPSDNLTEILHNVKIGLDKKLNPGFGEVAIDNAERGAILDLKKQLTDWIVKRNPDYAVGRAEHEKASKAIKAFTDRAELAANPAQPTRLGGGINVAEQTRPHLPQMLSTPMMLSNAVLRALGKNVEPKIDAIAAARALDPAEFAKAMDKLQLNSAQRSKAMQMIQQWSNPFASLPGGSAATFNALSGAGAD